MKTNFLKYSIVVILLSFMAASCAKEVDFNQIDDLSLTPVFTSGIIFFKSPASNFYVNGVELVTVKDSVIFDLFNRDFVLDNLVKAELVFETTNSINKSFNLQVDFLDRANHHKHSFAVISPASTTSQDIITTHTEVFENGLLDALKTTNKVVLTIQALTGGLPLNNNTPGSIQLKSKGIFYLKIETSE